MIAARTLLDGWQAFWFAPVSPLPLAAFRILFGLVVLANGLQLAPDWGTWFGAHAVLAPETARALAGGARPDLFAWLPAGDGWTYLVYGAFMASALGLTLGLRTRTSAAALLVCILALHTRNPLVFNGADNFMRVVAFILIFSPAGAALSLDRRRLARGEAAGPPAPVEPWALRLLQLQLSALYLTTALAKTQGETWLDGTAIHYALRIEDFARFEIPFLLDHLWAIKVATWSALAIELALGTLVWVRELRYPVLLGGLLLHAGIGWAMTIPLFGLMMVATYVAFVDGAHLERALAAARAVARGRSPFATPRIV